MTNPEILNGSHGSTTRGHECVQTDHAKEIRQLLKRLKESIEHAERILGVSAADLRELTEDDHDRLALERMKHWRTR